jgi:preprotein translocase subunit SecD
MLANAWQLLLLQTDMKMEIWKKILACVVCLVASWLVAPNLLSGEQLAKWNKFLPENRLNLGLDLQGGSHLLLEVDVEDYLQTQTEKLKGLVRAELRSKQIGYTELRLKKGAISLKIRPETLGENNIASLMRRLNADIEAVEIAPNQWELCMNESAIAAKKKQLVAQTIEIIGRRIDELGTREPVIQPQGEGRILLQVAGLNDPAQLKTILGTTAKMTFHLVNDRISEADLIAGNVPLDTMVLNNEENNGQGGGAPYAVYVEEALSGDSLVEAHVAVQELQPVVNFRFDAAGARAFGEITAKNIGKQFAIVLDGKIITAPVIRSAILGGSGFIEGNFDAKSAENLALLLRAGALPADVAIVEERTVGASLGADSIQAGKIACAVAVVLVMGFMLLNYGIFGLFANIALLANLLLLMAALTFLQATLTLPGIAGIVLTLGMAVDANVLIFQRMREEFGNKIGVINSVRRGFEGAFITILDSNITTLISALVLFIFGSGTIKGFAVTLSIGILASMFSAILLTRIMIIAWVNKKLRNSLPI